MAGGADEAIGQNRTPLSIKQERVALLVAEDELKDEEIAEDVGIARSTLALWKMRPEIIARVAEHVEAFKDRALTTGFADKRARLKALDSLAFSLMEDMSQPATADEPKGTYRKEIKLSANGEAVEYVVYDKAKADSFRGYLDDIAKEKGERATKTEITGKDGETLVLTIVGVDVDRV